MKACPHCSQKDDLPAFGPGRHRHDPRQYPQAHHTQSQHTRDTFKLSCVSEQTVAADYYNTYWRLRSSCCQAANCAAGYWHQHLFSTHMPSQHMQHSASGDSHLSEL